MRCPRPVQERSILVAVVASLVVGAVACASGGSSAAPTGSTSVTPPATASASAPPLVQEGGAPMESGTYTSVFQPKITFTIRFATAGPWVSYADSPSFVQFERADGHGSIAFARIEKVFDPARAHKLMPVPKDYVGWITTLPGVRVLAGPKALTVDGIKGTEIDLQARQDAPTIYCKHPCVAIRPLGPGEVAALSTDSVARIVVIRLHGETVELSAGGADFTAVAKDFDAMLRTVRFG